MRRVAKWYGRAQAKYKRLPPWEKVTVRFAKLEKSYAHIDVRWPDKRMRQAKRAVITFDSFFARHPKLLLRELAHELVHIIHPRLKHGIRFEQAVIRVKQAMEPTDPGWY